MSLVNLKCWQIKSNGNGSALKDSAILYSFFFIMSRETILGMLRAGNTGEQILQILDTIVEEVTEQNINDFVEHAVALNAQPTLSSIDF